MVTQNGGAEPLGVPGKASWDTIGQSMAELMMAKAKSVGSGRDSQEVMI